MRVMRARELTVFHVDDRYIYVQGTTRTLACIAKQTLPLLASAPRVDVDKGSIFSDMTLWLDLRGDKQSATAR
jgi:hypothetical protein